jgi:ELWxxDGT repeat protein
MMIGKSKLYQVALLGLLLSLTVNLARAAGPEPFLVKDIYPGASGPYPYNSSPNFLTDVNGTLFFIANDGTTGNELWKSDGTAAGTVLVKDINPGPEGSRSVFLTDVNGTLFFNANDGANGYELWKSDGTEAGTVLVKDIWPGAVGPIPASSVPANLTDVNGTLYFQCNDGSHGDELWKSDGTEAGTVLIKDINLGMIGLAPAGSYPENLTDVNGTLFFIATDGATGNELWKSDGTEAGTVLIKDIHPGAIGSYPSLLTNVNGTLSFSAVDGANGYELWESDGTAAGTVLVKDINPGAIGSFPDKLTNVNGTLFFSATDGTTGNELWELWSPINLSQYYFPIVFKN